MNRPASSTPLSSVEGLPARGPGKNPAANAASASENRGASVGTRIFQNTAVQLGGRAASVVLAGVTSILLARYLGHERMGEYGAIYAYLSLYTWLATFGLEQILAREVSQRRAEAGSIFLTGTLVALCFSLTGIALSLLLAPSFGYGGSLRMLVLFAALDILLVAPISLVGVIFQVDMRQWYAVGIGLLRQVLWLLAVSLLIFGEAAILWIVLFRTVVGLATAALILPLCWRRKLLPGPWSFSWGEARQLVRFGFPLALSAVAIGVYHRIDQVMLHNMAGDRVLGPYVIAVQLIELFSTLPVALMSSLFPVLSQTARDEPAFMHYLGTSYRVLLLVVFGVCAVMTPVAAPMIQLLYGKEYLPTAALLIVLIWSEVPVFFGVVINSGLIARGLQRYLPASTIAGAIVNVVLNLAVIPRYGALGASWATVASYCLAGIFLFLVPGKTRPLATQGLRIALPLFLLALGITVLLGFLPGAFWWKLILACALYLSGAWLTGTLRGRDVNQALSLLRENFSYGRR